jgi:hypothetical protein
VVQSCTAFALIVAFGIGSAGTAAAGDAELQKARALQSSLDGRLLQLKALCQEWYELQPRAAKKQMRLGMYPKPDACLPEVQQYIRDQVAVMVKRAETGQDLQIPVPQWTMTMAGTDPEKLDETISKISGKVAEFRAAL